MNKLIFKYFFIFIGVGTALLFFMMENTPFGKSNSSFAVETEADITRIEFLQGDKKLSLEKTGDNWLINKGSEARKSAVVFILRTLGELKIKSPVSVEVFEKEVIKKEVDPIKVSIYEKRKLVKSFFVYKTGSNIYGNIMKMKASSKPFIVYLPGYEDNLGSHFVVNELFWKPYIVFNLLPSQIASVKLENIADTSSSFVISCKNKVFSLSDSKSEISGWDTLKVKRYFSYYTSIQFESWAFDLSNAEKDSIDSMAPVYRIAVKPQQGPEIILSVWQKWNLVNGEKKSDTDRVWAKTNLKDEILVMRYFDLDPILKKRSYFFTQ